MQDTGRGRRRVLTAPNSGRTLAMSAAVIPGCEPISHIAGSSVGVLAVHGFTGTPASLGGLGAAIMAAGFDLELPRLPGHGTSIDDMLTTDWDCWIGEVERAYQRLESRTETIVLVGQSMGGTLVLRSALDHPNLAGVVCINPLTRLRDEDTMALLDELIEDGILVVPGDGSDIADPDASDKGYSGTPLVPLRSLMLEGVAHVTARFGQLKMPLRIITSRQDHVVEPANSEFLAAEWGGTVEHSWLERSFHVATLDFEHKYVEAETVAFVSRVTSA